MIQSSDLNDFMTALCVWREARGEPLDALRAVAWVVHNRVARKFRGTDAVAVVLWPYQFSSFNRTDPNCDKFPANGDASWTDCVTAVNEPGEDPTGGALMYFSGSAPHWASHANYTARVGAFSFYRE